MLKGKNQRALANVLQEPLQGRSNTHRSNIMGNNIHRCYTRNKVDKEQSFCKERVLQVQCDPVTPQRKQKRRTTTLSYG